jgi:peroxiredoxin (alkyl hydroperoxide reductase subunit C)
MVRLSELSVTLFLLSIACIYAHTDSSTTPLSYHPQAAIRKPAPDFITTAWDSGKFRSLSLSEFKGKYVVLFFYPLDFTFVCPTEIINFSDLAEEFRANDCEVLACSIDSHFVHREWTLKPREEGGLGNINFPLLSDLTKQIGKDYGVYLDHSDDAGVHLRGTFIIDRDGILRHISINDLPVGRNAREVLRLVQAFQYTDSHGEVCPESWTPGADTMVTDHESEKTKEYFKTKGNDL